MVRKMELLPYHRRAIGSLSQFEKVEITHIRRATNGRANALLGVVASFTIPVLEGNPLRNPCNVKQYTTSKLIQNQLMTNESLL